MRLLAILVLCSALFSSPLRAAEATESTAVKFPRLTAATKLVADRYIKAYFDKDWDALAELAGESIRFNDPTAKLIFGNAPASEGKAAVMNSFRTGYAALEMRFSSLRDMYSGEHAFYEGTLEWDMHLPGRDVHSQVPMIVILNVVDGKVIAHTDFVDYQPFIDAEMASRPPAAESAEPED